MCPDKTKAVSTDNIDLRELQWRFKKKISELR